MGSLAAEKERAGADGDPLLRDPGSPSSTRPCRHIALNHAKGDAGAVASQARSRLQLFKACSSGLVWRTAGGAARRQLVRRWRFGRVMGGAVAPWEKQGWAASGLVGGGHPRAARLEA